MIKDIEQNKDEAYYIKAKASYDNIDKFKNDKNRKQYFKEKNTMYYRNSFSRPIAYVVNQASNSVSVVDIKFAKVITDIPVGNSPWEIDISPNQKFAYVSNYNDGTLMIISTVSNKIVDIIDLNTNHFVSSGPTGVKVSPNGQLIYVGNWKSKNILVVDAYKKIVLSEIPIGEAVSLMDITSDGKFIYAALPNANMVSVVDTHINLPIKYLNIANRPMGITIQKNYPLALIAVQESSSLAVINTNSIELSSSRFNIGDLPTELIFHPKCNIVYVVSQGYNNVSAIDIFAHRKICTMAVGTSPLDIAITKEGDYIVVPNVGDGTVSILNTITGRTRTVIVGSHPYSIGVLG